MITENKFTLHGNLTWFICTLFFMYEFLLRTILGTFQSPIMQDLNLTPVQFALLSSTVYQLMYGLMQLPGGIIIDYLGIKKALLGAAVLCTVANMGFYFCHDFSYALFFRMLMGLGSSCGFVCLLIAIYEWIPKKNIALFIGVSQFIGTLGPMFAAGPLSAISMGSGFSWRDVFFSLAAVGLVLSMLIFLYVDNNRRPQGKFIILNPGFSFTDAIVRLIKQKQIWFIAVYSACVYFSIEYLTENEGTLFLMKKGCSATLASYMITISWLGYAIASPALGYLSDKFQRRKPFMLGCACITLFSLIVIIYIPVPQVMLGGCFALLGMGASGGIIGFTIMAEQCTPRALAAGMGINNTLIVVSSAVNAPLMGYFLVHASRAHAMLLSTYQTVFLMMIGLALAAVLITLFAIKETFGKSMCNSTVLNVQHETNLSPEPQTLASSEEWGRHSTCLT